MDDGKLSDHRLPCGEAPAFFTRESVSSSFTSQCEAIPIAAPAIRSRGQCFPLATLLEAGVGVWDVIASAERLGSLDTNIRNHQANALADFAATLPELRAVAFNGGKASSLGRKQLGLEPGYALITLPSSSPAHAALSFEQKRAEWQTLASFVRAEA